MQAGTKSWKAFFFGSTDSSNFITVDKTPASLWVMELSARIFGVNAWSILVPQALEGVAAVGILFATVKRWFAPGAALAAGAVFALTPVAALMFRFNNPDALLVLCLVASAYAMTRALEHGRLRWLVAAGVLVGLAFLAKELQALLVLPGFGLVYLIAGPPQLARRVGHVLALGCAAIAGARMVGRDRAAVARVEPALFRRVAEQQLLERAVRLQRLRPPDRRRVGQRRRWSGRDRGAGGRRVGSACSTRRSGADLVAAARRAPPARGRPGDHRPPFANRPDTRRARCSGAAGCS